MCVQTNVFYFKNLNGGERNMLTTMFLTGLAHLNFSYDLVQTLKFGFGFNSQTLSEILGNLFNIF